MSIARDVHHGGAAGRGLSMGQMEWAKRGRECGVHGERGEEGRHLLLLLLLLLSCSF